MGTTIEQRHFLASICWRRVDAAEVDGTYEEVPASRLLPVSAEEITAWIERADGADLLEWTEDLRERVRLDLAPRHAGGEPGR